MTEDVFKKAADLRSMIATADGNIRALKQTLVEPQGIKLVGRKGDTQISRPELCKEIAGRILMEMKFERQRIVNQLEAL